MYNLPEYAYQSKKRRYTKVKRKSVFVSLMILTFAMFVMVSCGGGPTLAADVQDESHMVFTAKKAAEGDFVLSGTLKVGKDQQILIDSQLDPGAVQLDFISNEGMDNVDEVPEEAAAKYTANVSGIESQAVFFGEGEYMVRVTVSEKATGTVDLQVKEIGEE